VTANAIPTQLIKLFECGRLVPAIGADLGGANPSQALQRMLTLLADCDFPAILSLASEPEVATILTGRGWQVKDPSSPHYVLGTKLLIQLAPDEAGPRAQGVAKGQADPARDEPFLWGCALAFAAREALLVMGCDPRDIAVRAMLSGLRPAAHFRRGGWVVWHSAVDPDIELQLLDAGFELIVMTTSQVIVNLQLSKADNYFRDVASLAPLVDASRSPYKLLHYYEVGDTALFCGRDQEVESLANLISAYPLVVVTGASGSGKTSLLNAGIIARFAHNPPYEGWYVRIRDDPWKSLESALDLTPSDGPTGLGEDDDGTFASLVVATSERDILPVVILDQFEELFIRFPPLIQTRFCEFIRRCLISRELPVRFVLAIRDDYLGKLAAMRRQYPALLQNTFYVPPLTRAKALDAMITPAEKVGVRFDSALAWTIAEELQRRQVVSAPELQIVCHALFEARAGGEINEATYRRLGGCQKILATFMNAELSRRGEGFRLPAGRVLKALVTSERTKENLPVHAIARRAKLDLSSVWQVLRILRDDCRFVRNLPGEEDAFELSHDYLAGEIWSWMSDGEKEERLAHDLLDRELRAWKQFGLIRLGPDRLSYFQQTLHDELLDDDGLLYLLLSSVRYLEGVERWTGSLMAATVERRRMISRRLFDFFEDSDLATRREAAEVIGTLEPTAILDAIGSAEVSSSRAAIEIAGGLRLEGAVEPLRAIIRDDGCDLDIRVLACGALGEIAREQPKVLKWLIRFARTSDHPRLRHEVICGIAHACAQADAFDLLTDAMSSDDPGARQASITAIRQGPSAKLLERLVAANRYEDLAVEVKSEIWDAILRSGEAESRDIVQVVAKSLKREDLLRYTTGKWNRPWLEDVLIEEFCERWPNQCSQLKRPECADLIEACSYTVQWMRRAVQANCAQSVIAHFQSRSDFPALGHFLRELVGTGERDLRVMAFRLAWFTDEPVEMSRGIGHFLTPSRMRGFLKSQDARERYWACLITGFLAHRENVELLRELSSDRGQSDPHDPIIGFEVGDAARHMLDLLAPGSAIWRKPWQRSFRDMGRMS
jgi:hypothetical protein